MVKVMQWAQKLKSSQQLEGDTVTELVTKWASESSCFRGLPQDKEEGQDIPLVGSSSSLTQSVQSVHWASGTGETSPTSSEIIR